MSTRGPWKPAPHGWTCDRFALTGARVVLMAGVVIGGYLSSVLIPLFGVPLLAAAGLGLVDLNRRRRRWAWHPAIGVGMLGVIEAGQAALLMVAAGSEGLNLAFALAGAAWLTLGAAAWLVAGSRPARPVPRCPAACEAWQQAVAGVG